MRLRFVPETLLLLLSTGGFAPAQTVAKMASSTADPRFGRPVVSGIQGTGFEQNIRLAPGGVVYTSVPGTLSSAHSWIWRSTDAGQTFKWVPAAAPLTGKLPTCVGGGDTELAVDSAGNLYYNDLTLANFSVARSDNGGVTFTPPSCFSTETTPNDRQWYATDGDPTNGGNLYLVYNIVGGDPSACARPGGTEVGNNVLVLARSPAAGLGPSAGVVFAPSKLITGPCDEAIMGNVEVSPVSRRVFIIHDNAALNAIRVARCEAVPFLVDPTGLSCVDRPVASFPGYKTGGNFPTMAIDAAGSLFAVWQQAPIDEAGNVIGDTLLHFSSSRNEGETWTPPVQVPTPGLRNNVFAWAAAGDAGRVNIAWYGTPAGDPPGGCMGPDGVDGDWSVYLTQTLNGTDPVPTFTAPILASDGPVHRGATFTLIGAQCAPDRTSTGDFLQLRTGPQGEAYIAYSDARSVIGGIVGHATIVRQNGGTSLLASDPRVPWQPPATDSVADPAGDARFEANGVTSSSRPNLDVLSSFVRLLPDGITLRVTMTVADLRSLSPDLTGGSTDPVLVWSTQWVAPSTSDPDGGRRFHAYMESAAGGAPRFLIGQNAVEAVGGGVMMTYPGATVVAGSYTATAPGTITIDVPLHLVGGAGIANERLHVVTASTMTLPQPADSVPSFGGVGGSLFNLVDVAPPYEAVLAPNAPPAATDDAADAARGSAVTIDVLANDVDPGGDALTIVAVTQAGRGAVTNHGDRITYVPSAVSGKDSFTYTVSDGRGGTDTAAVNVRLRSR